jgi:ankyrin repeat protein
MQGQRQGRYAMKKAMNKPMSNPLILAGALCAMALSAASLQAIDDPRLIEAVKASDRAAVQALLGQPDVNVNARQPDGATALHWAALRDDIETADLLIRAKADVNAANDYGVVPLTLACTNGSAPMVQKLLDAGANARAALPSGETVLMTCARAGNAEAVKALLAGGANPNDAENEKQQTALMWAVAQKHPEAARVLIEHGADIRARSKDGFTPLLFAARVGDTGSARVLLEAGVDVNEAMPVKAVRAPVGEYETPGAPAAPPETPPASPASGMPNSKDEPAGSMTPLLMASASGHEQTAIFLLENGANPNAVDEYGTTALHYSMLMGMASMNGVSLANYVSYLFRPNMPELVKALLARGADPNVRLMKGVPVAGGRGGSSAGATPFLLAAASADANIMRILLERGADPLITTTEKLTPLMAAAGVGRVQDFTDAEERSALEAVKLAVEQGADVNAANEKGRTALHGATNLGGNSIVEFLAQKGANLDARDQYQQTPLSIASGVHLPWTPKGEELGEVVRKDVAELLLRLGATPLTTPGYFVPVEQDSDIYKMNPKRSVPGASGQ